MEKIAVWIARIRDEFVVQTSNNSRFVQDCGSRPVAADCGVRTLRYNNHGPKMTGISVRTQSESLSLSKTMIHRRRLVTVINEQLSRHPVTGKASRPDSDWRATGQ